MDTYLPNARIVVSNTLPVVLAIVLAFACSLWSPDAAIAQSANACTAEGQSLSEAQNNYSAQCLAPRVDCDPIGSLWICSSEIISETISATQLSTVTQSSTLIANQAATNITNRPAVPVLNPAGFPGAGNQNGRPICLADANAVNGYSYENGRSCIVVPGVTASSSNPLIDNRICSPWMEIGYGNYVLQNNVWNSSAVFSNNWSQCIELGGTRGNYIAKWDYNWLDRTQGEEYAVKSYPQVYYGRKTEFNRSGTIAETGLPVNINQLPRIRVDFKYRETGNAERNVALESFLHTSCETSDNNKHFEMMVWVDKPSIRTPGAQVTTASIDGRSWDVFTNPQLTWGYVAFVAQQPITEATLDWNAFIDWSRTQGPAFGVPPTGNNTCLGAVEFGTETFWGNGTFTLERFNVQVSR